MSGELISREYLREIVGGMPTEWEYGAAVSDIYDIIMKAPAVDAVEVVRCRDCKYGLCNKTLTGDCYYECDFQRDECLSDEVYSPDYYCAYGERREES